MDKTTARPAAIYCRISRDKKGEALGVERQEADCRKRAKQLGWTVRKVYVDNDLSAYNLRRPRPGYRQLLADIEAGLVTAVIAYHPSRLHRRTRELENYIDLCESHDVANVTVSAGQWDLSTASGRMTARIIGAVDQQESELKAERVAAACQQRASAGKWSGGRRCYGWEPDGKTPREEEAQVLREAANQIAQGISLRAVVADLNKRKVPTTNGAKPWVSLTLKDALIAPRNAGYAAYHGEIVGDAEWPAIIARDAWHAVEHKLTDPDRRTNGHVGGTVKWLGSGIYRCGVCGSTDVRVHTHSGSGKKRYRCRNRIKGEPVNHVGRDAVMLDAYVEAALVARLSEPKVLKRLTPKGPGVDVSALRKEIQSARKALKDIAAGLGNSQITMAMAAESTAIATARIQQAEARLAASGDGNPLAVFSSSSDIAATWYGPGGPNGDRVGGLSLGTRREILRLMADVTILRAPFGPAVDGRGFKEECVRIDFKS